MLWAASNLCFFSFLCMGKAVVSSDSGYDPHCHLSHGNIRVDSIQKPSWLAVTIKRSKTDQLAQGVTLSIGATGTDLCPVAAMLGYLIQRGESWRPRCAAVVAAPTQKLWPAYKWVNATCQHQGMGVWPPLAAPPRTGMQQCAWVRGVGEPALLPRGWATR